MTTYYVRTNGADGTGGHDGTTPALAWLTLGYATTHVAAGDTIWVGAGTYRVSASIAPTSLASMTYLYGDTDGSHTGDAGEVIVTGYSTNDTTAPANVHIFDFTSKNYWTIAKLTIIALGAPGLYAVYISGTSANLTFADLSIWAASDGIVSINPTFGTVQNITIERCRIVTSRGPAIYMEEMNSATGSGDINLNNVIRNCVLVTAGHSAVYVHPNGTNTARKAGGITVSNCLMIGGSSTFAVVIVDVGYGSTTYPVTVNNCLILSSGTAFISGALANQIVEDYNVIDATTARTGIASGANSYTGNERMWRFSVGHEASFGGVTRPFGEPVASSPLLSFGGTGIPTLDINGVTRPASGAATVAKALGPFERANSATRETSTVRTGSTALKIAGPGYHDFALPVAATSTTVTVYVRWDATYAGTKPKMQVLNGGECGVADATATATGSSGAWEQLSLDFTPTSAGIVTIRLLSSDTNGGGAMFADDFAVS